MNHINMQNAIESVTFETIQSNNDVNIKWRFGARMGVINLTTAKTRAADLFTATSIADIEAVIAMKLIGSSGYAKGSPRWKLELAKCLVMVRDGRPEWLDGIAPIFCVKQFCPIVRINWYGEILSLSLDDAICHAQDLLDAASAAQTDLYFLASFKTCGVGAELQERIFASFAKFRSDYHRRSKHEQV